MEYIDRTEEELLNWLATHDLEVIKGLGFSNFVDFDDEYTENNRTFCKKGIYVHFYRFIKKPINGYNKENEYSNRQIGRMLKNKVIKIDDTFILKLQHYEKSKLLDVMEVEF